MHLVRFIRLQLGLSQKQMGSILGISRWRVSGIEGGRPMTIQELLKLLDEFGKFAFYKYNPVVSIKVEKKNVKQE